MCLKQDQTELTISLTTCTLLRKFDDHTNPKMQNLLSAINIIPWLPSLSLSIKQQNKNNGENDSP